jgi:hypothetical protein
LLDSAKFKEFETKHGVAMALFFLTYDLRKKRDYQKLFDELANFKAVRALQSTWYFNRARTTVVSLRKEDAIKPYSY